MSRLTWVVTVVVSALLPAVVSAGDSTALPEPGTFELLALGGVVAAVITIRKWRRK